MLLASGAFSSPTRPGGKINFLSFYRCSNPSWTGRPGFSADAKAFAAIQWGFLISFSVLFVLQFLGHFGF